MTSTAVFSLTLPDNIPDWLAGSPARHIQQMIQFACVNACITGSARLRFLCEMDVLKKKNLPASSIVLQNSSRYHGIDTLTLIATGKDARNHKVRCTLTMDSVQCERFATFITDQPQNTFLLESFRNPVIPPSASSADTLVLRPGSPTKVVSANSASTPERSESSVALRSPQGEIGAKDGQFDDDALALYLSSIRDLGGTVTQSTAESLATQATGSTEIIHAVFSPGYLQWSAKDILSITAAGQHLLDRVLTPPQGEGLAKSLPPQSSPSQFDLLKAAVITARQHHATIEAGHLRHRAARATIQRDLDAARQELTDREKAQKELTERLANLAQRITTARQNVLSLEAKQRELPDESALHAAQRDLEAAELAYSDLIKF